MVLRMASATMVLALMVSLKDMANSPLPMASSLLSMDNSLPSMANSLLHLLIRPRLMGKRSSSNLLDISRLHSQLTLNSLLISHQLMPSSLPILQHLHRSALYPDLIPRTCESSKMPYALSTYTTVIN